MSKPRKKVKRACNPLKTVLIGGGVFLVLLVAVLLYAKAAVNGWLHGEGFRDWLTKRTSVVLHSEVTLTDMKWEGSEVYADRFSALGTPRATFSELRLDGVRAKMGGVRNEAFHVPEITVNRLNLEFSPGPKVGEEAEIPASEVDVSPESTMPEWLARFTPSRVEVDKIIISSASVSVLKAGGEAFSLSGTHTIMEPDFETGFWEISGKGGKMHLPDQPEIRLKDLGLRWRGSDLFVDRCALGIYKDGHIDGTGEIGFENGGRFDVDLAISSINVDELITGEWRDRLSGIIHGPVHIDGPPGALTYEGTLNVTGGIIESIPVLKRIAQYTRSERFNRLVLNEAKTDFKKTGDRVELRNLVLQSDSLVRIEGQIDIVGDQLTGDLQVGVTPGTMRWIPGAERLVFVEDRAGFRWAPLHLTGTTAEPKEDLSARLIAAAGESIISELPEGLLKNAQELLGPGAVETKPGDVLEQGKKMLDLLSPFLKGQ